MNSKELVKLSKIHRITKTVVKDVLPQYQNCKLLSIYIHLLKQGIISKGLEGTLKASKDARSIILNFINNTPVKESKYHYLKKNGLPSGFPERYEYLFGTNDGKRYLMTIFMITRSFQCPTTFDSKPITTSIYTCSPISQEEIKLALKRLGVNRLRFKWKEFHLSMKAGPNGQATLSSVSDLHLLPSDIQACLDIVGGPEFANKRKKLLTIKSGKSITEGGSSIFENKDKYNRKLVTLPDKEGKSRIVAIFDYWTQTVLKPMHDSLMGVLNGINMDCTHDQGKFKRLDLSKPSGCYDLVNATDRFPISFQKEVLSVITNSEISESWAKLLVGLPLKYQEEDYSYGIGQPMGAFTSFPMFGLSHHVLVQIAAIRNGKFRFTDYAILGDDIMIQNKQVAETYFNLMSQLHVEISHSKSYCGYTIEFAKRYFYRGEEFTGYSISAILENWKSYPLLMNTIEQMKTRGYHQGDDKQVALTFVKTIYDSLRPGLSNHIVEKCHNVTILRDLLYKEDISVLKDGNGNPVKNVEDKEIIDICRQVILDNVSECYLRLLQKELLQRDLFQKKVGLLRQTKKELTVDKEMLDILCVGTPPFLALIHKANSLMKRTKEWVNEVQKDTSKMLVEEMSDSYFIEWGIFTLKKEHRRKFVESKIYTILADRLRKLEKGDPIKWTFPYLLKFKVDEFSKIDELKVKPIPGRTMVLSPETNKYVKATLANHADANKKWKAIVKTDKALARETEFKLRQTVDKKVNK